jgi:hypothetical protein
MSLHASLHVLCTTRLFLCVLHTFILHVHVITSHCSSSKSIAPHPSIYIHVFLYICPPSLNHNKHPQHKHVDYRISLIGYEPKLAHRCASTKICSNRVIHFKLEVNPKCIRSASCISSRYTLHYCHTKYY